MVQVFHTSVLVVCKVSPPACLRVTWTWPSLLAPVHNISDCCVYPRCVQGFPASLAESDLDVALPAGTGDAQYLQAGGPPLLSFRPSLSASLLPHSYACLLFLIRPCTPHVSRFCTHSALPPLHPVAFPKLKISGYYLFGHLKCSVVTLVLCYILNPLPPHEAHTRKRALEVRFTLALGDQRIGQAIMAHARWLGTLNTPIL